jgi:hypothetical protein
MKVPFAKNDAHGLKFRKEAARQPTPKSYHRRESPR